MTFMQDELRLALESEQFVPFFQPVIHLRTNELRGYEMLARWVHPVHGVLAPDRFIARAETEGWIAELTASLLARGCRAMGQCDPDGKRTLAVNISPVQLRDRRLPQQIAAAAESAGFPLTRLVVEITESALMEDMETARSIVSELKEAGVQLALDDFGTGYSSLLHLQSLPFDELKVDRSFVSTMTTQRHSRKIVAAVVGLGQSIGLTTVAEGVETAEQAEMLLWLGCEMGQGWLYGKPVAPEELTGLSGQQPHQMPAPSSLTGRLSLGRLDRHLAQSQSQLQAIYDGAPVGLAYIDREQRYVHLNRRLAMMNGRSMEEHLGRTVREMIPGHYRTVESFIERALQGEALSGVEITKPSAGGGPPQTLLLSYEPAFDEANEVVGVSVAISDVTAVKETEAALRATEEHFRYMMELIPQIPWVIDAEGRALDVSQRWLTLSGMTGENWRGFGWLDALHPEDREPTISRMQASFRSGRPIDLQYRVRSGPDVPWQRLRSRGAPRRASDGSIECWYGVLELVDDSGTSVE